MTNVVLLKLLTWLSPAFPTGGFAYSHALEWSIEAGAITTESSLTDFLTDTLFNGALWSDAILLRHAHRGAEVADGADVAALGAALCASAERRLETLAQGAAFRAAAAAWPAPALADWGDAPLPYPVAVALLAAAHNVGEDDTTLAYLHAAVQNLISAAIRLIPLGQAAGLRIQAALEPPILATVSQTRSAALEDLGTACFAADIASMHHETQHTRLFRT